MSTWSPAARALGGSEVGTAKARSPSGISDDTGPARTRANRDWVTGSPDRRSERATRPAACSIRSNEPGGAYGWGIRTTRSWEVLIEEPREIRSPATTTARCGPAPVAAAETWERYERI